MKRSLALGAVVALMVGLAIPAGAKSTPKSSFALAGEARALEVALGAEGVTLGLALAQADSTPSALGIGAGQCTLLGDTADPNDLPCTNDTTEKSAYPGDPGDENPTCSGALPAPLDAVLTLQVACGNSTTKLVNGKPMTRNNGRVAKLSASLPVEGVLPVDLPVEQVDQLVDDLVDTLSPVLDQAPDEVRNAIDNVLEVVDTIQTTDVLAVEVGASTSNVIPDGNTMTVESTSAGARIGVLGLPSVLENGQIVGEANPLENGLLIIEIGTAQASASVDSKTALGTAAASPALVTVKVRDITKTEPTYVTVSVNQGDTVTVLEGTPAESTITAADSTTSSEPGDFKAAADAVRLHLLKGLDVGPLSGGIKIGLARATAAAKVAVVKPKPPIQAQPEPPTPDKVLPLTGGTDRTVLAIVLLAIASGALIIRRRFLAR